MPPESTGRAFHDRPLLVSPGEASDLLGISRWTVYQLIRRGALPAVKLGTARRIPYADVERLAQTGVPVISGES